MDFNELESLWDFTLGVSHRYYLKCLGFIPFLDLMLPNNYVLQS
jgi:hypothetical protein